MERRTLGSLEVRTFQNVLISSERAGARRGGVYDTHGELRACCLFCTGWWFVHAHSVILRKGSWQSDLKERGRTGSDGSQLARNVCLKKGEE